MNKISVIIPNYNHGKYLKARLDSIITQSYNFFEIIILDDYSNDDSRKIIELYKNHPSVSNIILSDKNSGSPFKQWSKGIRAASNEWIWIAESDDLALPSFLEEGVKIIANNPSVAFIFCNSIVEDNGNSTKTSEISKKLLNSDKWERSYWSSGLEEINTGLKYFSNIPNASAVIFKKNIAVEYLQKLEKFRYCGDWFLYISILKKNPEIYYNHNCLNIFRRTTESHSVINKDSKIVKKKKELFIIFKALYQICNNSNKKELLYWFTKYHIGLGFQSEGVLTLTRSIISYFIIDPLLTIKYLITRIMFKFVKN